MSKMFNLLGVSVIVAAALSPTHAAQIEQPVRISTDSNSVRVQAGNMTLLQYRFGGVPFKPYIKELATPGGINVLLDAPSDHLHHHALMFACAVDNVDFWGEAVGQAGGHFEPQPGKQQHLRFEDVGATGPDAHSWARFTESVRWASQQPSEPLLAEDRTVIVSLVGNSRVTFVGWESRLAVPEGKESVVLSGSHYHGLGLRFIRSMDATGEFRNPDNDPGAVFRGEERLTRSRWCAYTAQADGRTVTVAMFDHPENPRHPATWFTMAKPFAYMSATLRLHEEPLKVLAGKPVALRYGVALWDGRPETAQIDDIYRRWLTMSRDAVGQ